MVAAARCCRRASATMRWLDVGRTGAAASSSESASADDDDGPPSCGRGWDDLLEGVLVVVGARVAPALVLHVLAADAAAVEVPGAGPRREADADARVRPVMRGRATDGWTGRW